MSDDKVYDQREDLYAAGGFRSATAEESHARLSATWAELCAEIDAVALQVKGLKAEMLARDERIESVHKRVGKLREYAVSRRDELAADIARCGADYSERALMQQSLAHLFELLETAVRVVGELK